MSADPAEIGCETARRSLWPQDGPRRVTAVEERARRHLQGCDACQAFFRRDRIVGRLLASRREARVARRELRERVYEAIARERTLLPSSGHAVPEGSPVRALVRSARLPALALLATAVLAGTAFVSGRPGAAGAYVEDFVSRAVEEDAITTSDPARVSRFFMREMGLSLPPADLRSASLSQAMICLIRGERAAMVEYEWRGHTVAHYRLPRREGPRLPAVGPSAGEPRLRTAAERGVHVVRWEDAEYEHAVVSELALDQLVELVRGEFPLGGG